MANSRLALDKQGDDPIPALVPKNKQNRLKPLKEHIGFKGIWDGNVAPGAEPPAPPQVPGLGPQCQE